MGVLPLANRKERQVYFSHDFVPVLPGLGAPLGMSKGSVFRMNACMKPVVSTGIPSVGTGEKSGDRKGWRGSVGGIHA